MSIVVGAPSPYPDLKASEKHSNNFLRFSCPSVTVVARSNPHANERGNCAESWSILFRVYVGDDHLRREGRSRPARHGAQQVIK